MRVGEHCKVLELVTLDVVAIVELRVLLNSIISDSSRAMIERTQVSTEAAGQQDSSQNTQRTVTHLVFGGGLTERRLLAPPEIETSLVVFTPWAPVHED